MDQKNKNNIRSIDQVIKTPKRSIIARSKKQSDYLKALQSANIIMSLGPAGTGLTKKSWDKQPQKEDNHRKQQKKNHQQQNPPPHQKNFKHKTQ